MTNDQTTADKPRPPRRPGECDPDKHRWIDVVQAGRKKVVCEACGKFYGFYESIKSPSCLSLIG